tara:strand:+ start:116 stop:904 length:789 start_codon:yes stop_codon:yes gene_type:complete
MSEEQAVSAPVETPVESSSETPENEPALAQEAIPGESLLDTVDSDKPLEVDGATDIPSWFKSEKYKTVEDQAKAYAELEKRMGSFTGAPETDYVVPQVEGLDPGVIENNPMIQWFKDASREAGINQHGFDRFVSGYLSTEQAMITANKQRELAALGENAQTRLSDLADWGIGNLSDDEFQIYKGVASTAVGVKLLETLIGKTREAKLARDSNTAQPSGHTTREELKKLLVAVDENGNRKMSRDPEYRTMVNKLYQEMYGVPA